MPTSIKFAAPALTDFAKTRSPDAFADIVKQHIDLVYSVARRTVGDAHLAEDVTQATFLILARKAGSVDPRTLPGWLVTTTRLVARVALRTKANRDKHEARAAQMRRQAQSPANKAQDEPPAEQITPLLDEALSRLGEADRAAVVMRFLQAKTFVEIGAAMETSEDAARKRVERALVKLRRIFLRRGLAVSVGGLSVVLAAHQASAAPAAVATSVTATTFSGGSAVSATFAKGALSVMMWTKTIWAGSIVIASCLVIGGGILIAQLAAPIPPPAPTPSPISPIATRPAATQAMKPKHIVKTFANSIGMRFSLIPAGEFMMGSPEDEVGRRPEEVQHRVRITKPFLMGVTEVTQRQWSAVMGNNPSFHKGSALPVEKVSWQDAQAFCRMLSEKEGREYRLPTEAEWEYACRAGTTTTYNTGNDDAALTEAGWCHLKGTVNPLHLVGLKAPNVWGLYDMHGNVQEFCDDWYSEYPHGEVADPAGAADAPAKYIRIARGGSWKFDSTFARAASRNRDGDKESDSSTGFRVVTDGNAPLGDDVSWGPATRGLQMGLKTQLPRDAYRQGENLPLALLVRNIGTQPINLSRLRTPTFVNWQANGPPYPTIRDSDRKEIHSNDNPGGIGLFRDVVRDRILPGQSVVIGHPIIPVRAENWPGGVPVNLCPYRLAVGHYTVAQTLAFSGENDDWSGELTTGELGIEVIAADADPFPHEGAALPQWGPAVEGLRCRARLDRSTMYEGEGIAMLIDARNHGERGVMVDFLSLRATVEVDGVTVETPMRSLYTGPGPSPLMPGQELINAPLSLRRSWGGDSGGDPAALFTPGKHKIRLLLRVGVIARAPGFTVPSEPMTLEVLPIPKPTTVPAGR